MENTISNIAVISFPRTASKALVDYMAKEHSKLPAHGVLHKPEYLGKNDYNVKDIVFGQNHILHGHWHSLNQLDSEIYDFVKENYTIVCSHRPKHLVKKSLLQITGKDLYDDVYKRSMEEYSKWKISAHYVMSGNGAHIIPEPDPTSILV
jgi:hypothetical protein